MGSFYLLNPIRLELLRDLDKIIFLELHGNLKLFKLLSAIKKATLQKAFINT
ncbi:hypothetical protein THMIRHAM_17430 [Thiomicrorhabdus immobilis]|uniref:Uncharacterized protein n=1 Tax=Thiomicrorhabdus immobilis TaxID=2791037 RepID=A0ABN6CXZ9_9GAMM|nr:hypothetical protein THMIRHAM_17430 [Thiomicrorhabdus immobilis]